jgi:hypothetical protein
MEFNRAGIRCDSNDARLLELAKQGVTVALAKAACDKAKHSKPNQNIPFAYVLRILNDVSFKASHGNAGNTKPSTSDMPIPQTYTFAGVNRSGDAQVMEASLERNGITSAVLDTMDDIPL